MLDPELTKEAARLMDLMRAKKLRLVTAESCTGGLIAACFTDIAGSSDVFERGFVTYSNHAKREELDVPKEVLRANGAVSEPTAIAMAEGALRHSHAHIAVSCTGIAGPGGASDGKPVGLVHMALAREGRPVVHRKCTYGDIGRGNVRRETVRDAMGLIAAALED